ncbi:MAG: hypothetical protein ACC628_19035, partial [Pirellulaceae bacterium]
IRPKPPIPPSIRHFCQPSPRAANRSVPRSLDQICRTAMATVPGDRYQNVPDLIQDVERFLADEPVSVHRDRPGERVGRWFRRHRTGALAASISVVVIAICAITALIVTLRALDQARVAKESETEAKSRAERLAEQERAAREGREETLQKRGIQATERYLNARDFTHAGEELNSVPEPRRGWGWYRLKYEVEQSPRRTATLGTHDWGITALARSPDGCTIATAGLDGRVLAWDVADFNESRLGPAPCAELLAGSWSDRHLYWRTMFFSSDGEPENARADDCYLSLIWLSNHETTGNGPPKQVDHLLGKAILDIVFVPPRSYCCAQEDGTISVIDSSTADVLHQTKTSGPVWDLEPTHKLAGLLV